MRLAACAFLACGGLCLAILHGCGREPQSAAPSAGASGPSAADTTDRDGAPRIVDSKDRVHIQYRVYGTGEPLVVLIHGWSCDSNYWAAQLADLRAKYTVATVDLAGHGGSGANRRDWSMADFGEDVTAVVSVLPQRKVVLVGHSMGGPVALEAASRLRGRVVGVIGVDTFKSIGAPPLPAADVEARLRAFENDFMATTRAFVTQSFFTASADPALVRKIADDMVQAPPEVAIPSIRGLNAMDYSRVFATLDVPVIAINSDHGDPTDVQRIRKIAQRFDAVIVPGLGHFLMMEDPARFNPILLEQIERLAAD